MLKLPTQRERLAKQKTEATEKARLRTGKTIKQELADVTTLLSRPFDVGPDLVRSMQGADAIRVQAYQRLRRINLELAVAIR